MTSGASGSLQIRPASADDCRAIAELHVASWQAAYAGILDEGFLASLSIERREQSWRQVLAEGASELWVGIAGPSILGFASFGPSRDADAPADRGELWALYVAPSAWSTGAGRNLWHTAHARMHSHGFAAVSLWVLEQNTRAIRFYSAAGFKVEDGSAKQFDLGGRKVTEIRMIREGEGNPWQAIAPTS